jgi:hypothetical protein
VLIRYLIFCLGCGLLQTAASRTPEHANVLDVPILFVNPRMHIFVQSLALASVIAELVLGFNLYRWVGLVIWLPFIVIGNLVFPGKNPGPCFFVGILVVAVSSLLIALA